MQERYLSRLSALLFCICAQLTPDILGIHHLIKYGDFSDDIAEWLMNQRDEAELECQQ